MKSMTRMAVVDRLEKSRVGYVGEDECLEIRSWWKDVCTGVDTAVGFLHSCGVEEREEEIRFHDFSTLYGRIWRVGGCRDCGKIFYLNRPREGTKHEQ